MSKFNSDNERNAKSSIYLDKINQDCMHVLFLSQKCKHSTDIKNKLEEVSELLQTVNIMEIESLINDGEKLPKYIKGTPTLILQHKRTGQVMPPIEGDAVFSWVKDLIKPKGGSSTMNADDSGGVSIRAVHNVRFDTSKIKQGGDPAMFQEKIDTGKSNDDINKKLAELAGEVKNAWGRKGPAM
jgi:hypothetical protein